MYRFADWLRLEPVRTRLYPLVVLGSALLVGRGLLATDEAGLLVTFAGILLGVGGAAGIEGARARVTPVVKLRNVGHVLGRQGDHLS